MKKLIKLSVIGIFLLSLSGCLGQNNLHKHDEDASFMLMDKKNEHSHYKWMMEEK